MAVVGSIVVEYLAQGGRAFVQINKEIAAATAEVESRTKSLQAHLRGIVAPLAGASKAVIRFGDGMIHTGQVLSTFAYRLALITAPLAKFIYEAGQAGTELETTMAMVATQLDKGEKYIGQFTEETTRYITDLSTEIPLAADDIARAMYFLVSSMSIDPEVARSMLVPIAKAAVAGRATAEESAKAAAVIMNVYKLISDDADETAANLEHVYDVIFEAVKKGRAEYRDMASQLGDFMQFAKQAGATFEEAMALFAMATRVTTPSQAATWMSNLYRQFIRPKFAEAIAEWGIAIEDTTGKMRPAIEVLADIAEAVGRASGEQEKLNMIAEAFPRIRAVQGFLIFLENLTEIEEWTKSFTEAVGTTDEAFATMIDTARAKLTVLKNLFIAIGLDVFETYKEDLKRFLDFLGDVVKKLREMDPELKRQMFAWAGFLVALGPIALILGTILMGLGSLITVFGALISPPVLGAVLAGFLLFREELGTLWDVLRGISWQEIIAALLGVAQNLGLISDTQAEKVFKGLGIAIGDLDLEKVGGLRDSILGLVERLRELSEVGSDALAVVRRFFEMIEKRQGLIGTMIRWLERLAGAFAGIVGARGPELRAVETETWARLLDVMLALPIAIKVVPLLLAGLSGAFSLVVPLILSIVGAIAGISPLLLPIAAAIGILVAKFGDWGAALKTVSAILSPLIGTVQEFVGGLIDAFYEGGLEAALEYFKEQWPAFADDMKTVISEAVEKGRAALGDLFSGSIAFLKEKVPEWTKTLREKLNEWITGAIDWLKERVPVWREKLKEKLAEWKQSFDQWLDEELPKWKKKLQAQLDEWIGDSIEWLKAKLPEWKDKLKEKFKEWKKSFDEWLDEQIPIWKEQLKDNLNKWIEGAIEGLKEKVPIWKDNLKEKLGNWIQGAIDYVDEKSPDWGHRLGELMGGMTGAALTFMTETLPSWHTAMKEWISEGPLTYIWEHREEWARKLCKAIVTIHDSAIDFWFEDLPNFQTRMVDWFIDVWAGYIQGLYDHGPQWFRDLVDWFQDDIFYPFLDALGTTLCLIEAGKDWLGGFIQGIKDKASELYTTIMEIVRYAIGKAEEQAEAQSESRAMWRLGANMVRGFISGIGSQRDALAATLAGLADYGGFSLQPALAGMGAGAAAYGEVHHHYEYNISPRYEQVQSPADIRRDIEALDWARRHYRV